MAELEATIEFDVEASDDASWRDFFYKFWPQRTRAIDEIYYESDLKNFCRLFDYGHKDTLDIIDSLWDKININKIPENDIKYIAFLLNCWNKDHDITTLLKNISDYRYNTTNRGSKSFFDRLFILYNMVGHIKYNEKDTIRSKINFYDKNRKLGRSKIHGSEFARGVIAFNFIDTINSEIIQKIIEHRPIGKRFILEFQINDELNIESSSFYNSCGIEVVSTIVDIGTTTTIPISNKISLERYIRCGFGFTPFGLYPFGDPNDEYSIDVTIGEF